MTAVEFHHEAVIHAGDDEFLAVAVPFLREGLANADPMLVALTPRKLGKLRAALGSEADGRVVFEDMTVLGANPARIIPAWQDFAERFGGPERTLRGIGEPIWAGRSDAELVECHRHEALLNYAFADTPDFRLLCPYDTEALAPEVVAGARCSHPHLSQGPSTDWTGMGRVSEPFDDPLSEAPATAVRMAFARESLSLVRRRLGSLALGAGLAGERVDDLVLAASELLTNSVRYGGGHGELLAWTAGGGFVCEVRDEGRIDDPLAGRRRPVPLRPSGYGLWIANQVCDLVQMRTTPAGSVIRVHLALA
jgi:anti-sigma regulatory factor (Ser/Thr protein kinase)